MVIAYEGADNERDRQKMSKQRGKASNIGGTDGSTFILFQ